jgi:sugar lactone lactonase YvrE
MFPQGIAITAPGDLFIADSNNDVVEKVTPAGTVTVVAGNGTSGAPHAGPATSSPLGTVQAVAVDHSGDLFIADTLGYVEKVTPAGALSVVAGNGGYGAPRAGAATKTPVVPSGLAVDTSGNLFIADPNSLVVLKVTPGGTLSVVAGNGVQAAPKAGAALSSPVDASALALDSLGNLYLTDWNGYLLKETPAGVLSIIGGDGSWNPPLGGSATHTSVEPGSIAVDASGNVYVSGWTGTVERISPSGTLSVVAGTGTAGAPTAGSATATQLGSWIDGLAVSSTGTIYVADASNHVVEKVAR